MKVQSHKVCILIPTYNNAGTILGVVADARKWCEDVIVVNDGSTDDTGALLLSAQGITLVSYTSNRGKGYALKQGFRKALELGFDYAITMDGDGQHYASEARKLTEAASLFPDQLIIGRRQMENIRRPAGSVFANHFANFWFMVQTLHHVSDTQTGFRLYPLRRMKPFLGLITHRYEAELELLVMAAWHGIGLKEVPVRVYYPPREERVSHFRPFRDFMRITVLNCLLCLLALAYALPLALWRGLRRLLPVLLLLMATLTAQAQQPVNIWEGTGKQQVELYPYLAEGKNNVAVVVCPGGSYFWHDMEGEGHMVARWLQSRGVSAFVLRYRTASFWAFQLRYRWIVRGNRYPDPQDDLRQTFRLLRRRATEWGIDTARIGAMGFSAGGHLVLSSGILFPVRERPRFICALYPVVTMRKPWVHKRSRRALLGDDHRHNRKLQDSLSLELQVRPDCPPVFMANCVDDPTVDYHNSLLMDSALTARHVPHRYLLFRHGGHGFGANPRKLNDETHAWMPEFIAWLKELFYK